MIYTTDKSKQMLFPCCELDCSVNIFINWC